MSEEKEFGDALLRGESPIDIPSLTARVLKRDRRRIWLTGSACVIAWMLVVMLPWSTIMPMLAKVVEHQADLNRNAAITAEQREQAIEVLQIVKKGTIATFIGSLASMFTAAVFTIGFILFSRRATLRQVNARLAEISAQLKGMKA